MKAAVVYSFSEPPRYGAFEDPVPQPGEVLVTVHAVALTHLVRAQSSGRHYSSGDALPLIPGVDGVGKLPNGERVYFGFPRAPFGSMAEHVAIPDGLHVPVPDGLEDVAAAAIANPSMSSWAALTARAKLVPGETVLINGATGTAGSLAVRIAKHLGASRVIATGRNANKLQALLAIGADEVIALEQPPQDLLEVFRKEIQSGLDVILDYLCGQSAELLLTAASGHGAAAGEPRIRYVQIGAVTGPTISLPASVLRSSGLELMGSGLGSVSHKGLVKAIGELFEAAPMANLGVDFEPVPLSEVETAWGRDTGDRRLVFTL